MQTFDVVFGTLIVAAFITMLVFIYKSNVETAERLYEERIECIERTDDPAWCLEVIR